MVFAFAYFSEGAAPSPAKGPGLGSVVEVAPGPRRVLVTAGLVMVGLRGPGRSSGEE